MSRAWVQVKAPDALPFLPEVVGSHWATDSQVDVVAVNWREQAILLGECKWGAKAINRAVVRELLEKTPLVVPGEGWDVYYAFFGRAGFTDAARAEAQTAGALLVDLDTLYHDLRADLWETER